MKDLINIGTKENPVWVHKDAAPFSTPIEGGYTPTNYREAD